MSTPSPGWLPDPDDPTQWRYWDGSRWTDHRSPRGRGGVAAGPVPVPPTPGPTGRWYFVITIVSAGLLAAVPFFHAASRLDRPSLRKPGAAFLGTGLLTFALVGAAPTDASGDATGWMADVAAIIAVGAVVTASIMLIGPRREVYADTVIRAPSRNQGAVADVAEARRRREEARRLAGSDPMMARELGIGRPDVDRYDDGGLLDLNHATAATLTSVCGLSVDSAERVVAARSALGRFLSVDDAINFGQIGEGDTELVRERGIVIC